MEEEHGSSDSALIVSGGQIDCDQLKEEICKLREAGGMLIAADSGLDALRQIGVLPDVAVGDFDSVNPETLASCMKYDGFRMERHCPQKNESDTELAFRIAAEAGVRKLLLMGATGTRLDHVFSNVHLLKEAMDQKMECCLLDAHNRIRLAAGRMVFHKEDSPYPYISFVPLTMEVTHIKLTGFKYPLEDHHMVLGVECGHCISNEIAEEEAVLEFETGLLLAIESKD